MNFKTNKQIKNPQPILSVNFRRLNIYSKVQTIDELTTQDVVDIIYKITKGSV